ncbi:hypothetical protein LOK74_07160 [Brevibacillus humidisoli]|uniref:hypothetical protein n=1 Tax=Brevibacillus humidisoli TaxID=2895522 RepID=UPI001E30C21D|nr:hypothetical protein [Brevibacillus humidisoli]UFJ42263.1 hypothetical protein LOK74_07160 [Brevibacillus humidisoli]
MISAKQREMLLKQLRSDESKLVNIVLIDEEQVAGEIEQATSDGIQLVDGRRYSYDQIREINGLY